MSRSLLFLLVGAPGLVAPAYSKGPAMRALPQEWTAGRLEVVHRFQKMMPTGVTVSRQGRIFVNFPRWGDEVPFTVGELRHGEVVPYPDEEVNAEGAGASAHLLSVQSVRVDPADRLWILDTGRPRFAPAPPGGAKLVEVDLAEDRIVRTITFPPEVALPGASYLNDVRFDLRRGEGGMAFITDSSPQGRNAIVVVDLASGESWRRLDAHPTLRAERDFMPLVEGRVLRNRPAGGEPTPMTVGSDGIALDADGRRLYYRPLSGRGLFSVDLDALLDRNLPDHAVAATIRGHGDLGFASDGLEADREGRIYLTDYEDDAVLRWGPDGEMVTLVHDPRALWPDSLSLASDGWLYFTANQLHRQAAFQGGQDRRVPPYVLFRVQVHAAPVRLR